MQASLGTLLASFVACALQAVNSADSLVRPRSMSKKNKKSTKRNRHANDLLREPPLHTRFVHAI